MSEPGKVSKDQNGFVYVDGVKLGKATPEGQLEIKGCDLRVSKKAKKTAATLPEIAASMGDIETA